MISFSFWTRSPRTTPVTRACRCGRSVMTEKSFALGVFRLASSGRSRAGHGAAEHIADHVVGKLIRERDLTQLHERRVLNVDRQSLPGGVEGREPRGRRDGVG